MAAGLGVQPHTAEEGQSDMGDVVDARGVRDGGAPAEGEPGDVCVGVVVGELDCWVGR